MMVDQEYVVREYAEIEIATGIVTNRVLWDGKIWDGVSGYSIPAGYLLIQDDTSQIGWSYRDGVFSPPPVAPPTDEQVRAINLATLQANNILASQQKSALTNRIGTLQDAIDNIDVEGMEDFAATPDEEVEFVKRKTQLTQWKNYAIALGRVTAQSGWALKVTWPAQPKDGMDLSTSPTSAAASAPAA